MILPYKIGYRMPAEWEPHSATQLHWPSNNQTWPNERLANVQRVYLDIIEVLHRYESIILLVDLSVNPEEVREKLDQRKISQKNIHIYHVSINDVWARDCGPIFIKKMEYGERIFAITDWKYNAWGEKYPPFDSDNALPEWFAKTFRIPTFKPDMVLEGGSIETNGQGLFLTTESVLLNSNRNPGMTKQEIENRLRDFLGAEKVIWLKEGLAGDDTDGHVDDLSRFLNTDTIVTMVSQNKSDVNYEVLQKNYQILKKSTNQYGEPLRIETLPMPETRIEETTIDGSEFVPASYANFYIANGVVLLPVFNSRHDEEALQLLRTYFQDRDVIGINCTDLVWGQGGIHCITQQLYGLDVRKDSVHPER